MMKGRTKRPPRPTPVQTACLRKIAAGWLDVEMREGKPVLHYHDGGVPNRAFSLAKAVAAGWLAPTPGFEPLFRQIFAQRYQVRRRRP